MSQSQSSLLGANARRTVRARREATAEHHDSSQERWLLTYADMITLLLVLFIVLFALSKINQAKYRQFQQSVSHVKLVGTSVVHGKTATASRGPKPLSAAGHNGLWYWTQARTMSAQKEHWNAWLYYQQAQGLLVPVNFVQSTHLEKLKTEASAAAPPALSTCPRSRAATPR